MKLDSLVVLHLPKSATAAAEKPFAGLNCFVVESCLRWVAITRCLPESLPAGAELYQRDAAYGFLLEIACGLHSKIQGESEIFGQLKLAWKQWHEQQPLASRELHRLMQTLFADTKRIRTAHLQGIGGQSYAGAIQKLLHLRKDQSLLIIGAGQFGAMLAGKLKNKVSQLVVMNRSPNPLVAKPGWDGLEEAIAQATHVLVAIPCGKDEALDARIQAAWRNKKHGKLLHLAQMVYCGTAWDELPHFLGLADVMTLQDGQHLARPQAIAGAQAAIAQIVAERASLCAHAA